MPAAQFPHFGVQHFEILEVGERHGRVFRSFVLETEMSYAGLAASMGKRDCASRLD
jgi:hypothetical protein